MSGMHGFVGKAEASTEPIGEELISFFERHNYVVPNYDDPRYRYIDSVWYEDSRGIHKTAIVHPLVEAGGGAGREIVLNPLLNECMAKYQEVETPSGNLIRQGPIAFLIATKKGHSTLIVTCGNMVFGIGAIMSEPIKCLVVEPTLMEKIAAKFDKSVKPNTEEFAVDVVSPDPIFDLFTTKRSSTGISYAAGRIVALLPFRHENAQNLLRFLNQSGQRGEAIWEINTKTDVSTGEIYEIEIHTNVKYMTTSNPFRGTANIMNCANFLELIFAGIISGSAYAGLVSIPDTIRVTNGPVYSLFGLDSESQPETIFSPSSSPASSAASSPRGSPRSEIRGRSSPRRSPRGQESRSRSRSRDRDSFTPEEIERRKEADARYDEHLRRGDYRGRDNGRGIIKTKKEIKRERKTRKERERKRRTKRRKPRRSSTN